MIPLGYDEQYARYLELYAAYKKPLNKRDMEDGHVVWIPMKIEDRRAAFLNLRKRFIDTKDVSMVPFPRMHLFARSWERQVQPQSTGKACPKCGDCGWLYDTEQATACLCPIGVLQELDWGKQIKL